MHVGNRVHPDGTGMDRVRNDSEVKCGYSGDRSTRVIWQVVEAVINTRIKLVVQLHDVLHGFFTGRGAGNYIIDLKLVQELASVDQDPKLLVFLDLIKAYDNLDQGVLLQTLESYGEVPKIRGLLAFVF